MPIRFLFAHHKCASRFFRILLKDMGFNVLNYMDFLDKKVTLKFMDELDILTLESRLEKSLRDDNSVVSIINTTKRVFDLIENKFGKDYQAVHVIRDPRDILISAYFDHLDRHNIDTKNFYWPDLKETRKSLKTISREDGILYELNSITGQIFNDQLAAIPQASNILTIKLEDFGVNPAEKVQEISDFWSVSLERKADINFVPQGTGKKRSSPHDWNQHFTPKIKSVFKEKYSNLLIQLGYEEEEGW